MSRRSYARGSEHHNWRGGASRAYRKCEYCGRTFVCRPYDVGCFCSQKCRAQYHAEDAHIVFECEFCGQRKTVRRSDRLKRFCSRDCLHGAMSGSEHPNWKEKILCICEWCGKRFEVEPSYPKFRNHLFCSLSCRYKWHSQHVSGENAPNWQGGKSFEPYPPRFNRAFKKQIRERDDYTCAVCRMPGNIVHHLNYIKGDLRPENFITLCRKCHSATNYNRPYWQQALTNLLSARLTGASA